jgi:mono/diheme cytochrome c family protein
MRNFVLGIVIAVVVLLGAGLAFLLLGFMPTNANTNPSPLERRLSMHAMDASMDRDAPHINNPVPPTDDNLIEGMKIYTMNCALCHGTLDDKPSPLEHSMYPPPPQLILAPLDDPEWHIFYSVRTGVRYTGMPAWNNVLSEQEMWKVTSFLLRIEKLSPGVQDYWKKSFGVLPPSTGETGAQDKN